MTTAQASTRAFLTMPDGARVYIGPPLPDDVREGLEHLRLLLHDEDGPKVIDSALKAEWKSMWDTVNHLLDPEYDDGWRVES